MECTTVTVESREDVNIELVNIDGQWQSVDGRWFARESKPGGCLELFDAMKVPNSDLKIQAWITRPDGRQS